MNVKNTSKTWHKKMIHHNCKIQFGGGSKAKGRCDIVILKQKE